MPKRIVPLVTDQFYHIFNRGINKQPIFLGARDFSRALNTSNYYKYASLQLKFSKYLSLSLEDRQEFWERIKKQNSRLVEVISFCFMPNHFHFLLKQMTNNGVSKFMSLFQNSYTKYLNTKYDKIGPLLQGQFKAVRVEDENQLLHLSRYIHLNPYTSFVVKNIEQLKEYKWSSFYEYIGKTGESYCNKDVVLSHFKNITSYETFVFNQADYQRKLGLIKHLTMETD